MKKITTVKEAIDAVVTLNTLPPQIDYRVPQKMKAQEAEEFLETLSEEESKKAYTEITKQIEDYYSTCFTGEDGTDYSAADLNAMF